MPAVVDRRGRGAAVESAARDHLLRAGLRMLAANAMLLRSALEEPRSTTALPALSARAAASTVTLGRDS